jgi:cytoskeletal protein CcmA (bactofilin family)
MQIKEVRIFDMLKKAPFETERKERPENNRGDLKAFLGEGTSFKGVLAFEGTVRIDGKLEGEIITNDTLIIGEKAIVNAELNVGCIALSGKVTGNITAKERVDVHSSGEVYGNIKTPILTIEEGVIFQGQCDMRNIDEKKLPYVANKKDETEEKVIMHGIKPKLKSMHQLLGEDS